MTSTSLKYRPEIDGLRAVAVFSVVMHHAQFAIFGNDPFKGGFIGVDIFFVISGYLITTILLKEMNASAFSFLAFFERRARRILPALFVVLAVSVPFAWFLLLPLPLVAYAGSVLAAIGSVSNFWFWAEDSYWADPSQLKPFLHTWSLAVEEQFYLLFPPALLILHRFARRYLLGFFLIGFLVSLQLAQSFSDTHTKTAFYLLPMRGWELLAGSIIACIELERGRIGHPVMNAIAPPIGLYLIIHSVFTFNEAMQHPSFLTLEPIIGVMLLIWFMRPGEIISKLLSSKPFVWLGKISYSFYLWHFPVFAFARVQDWFSAPMGKVGFIALSLALSVASYRFIEQPARNKELISGKTFARVILGSAALLVALFALLFFSNGMFSRLPEGLYENAQQVIKDRLVYRENRDTIPVEDFSADKISVVVIGNSFSTDVSYMLTFDDGFEVHAGELTTPLCVAFTLPKPEAKDQAKAAKRCAQNKEMFFDRDYSKADVVVLADHNSTWTVHPLIRGELEANVDLLRQNGFDGPIIVYGERPKYNKHIFEILRELGSTRGADQYAAQYIMHSISKMRRRIKIATEYYQSIGVHYYSPIDELCNDKYCKILNSENRVLYHDNDHFSLDGDRYLSAAATAFVRETLETK